MNYPKRGKQVMVQMEQIETGGLLWREQEILSLIFASAVQWFNRSPLPLWLNMTAHKATAINLSKMPVCSARVYRPAPAQSPDLNTLNKFGLNWPQIWVITSHTIGAVVWTVVEQEIYARSPAVHMLLSHPSTCLRVPSGLKLSCP